ncbi:hypothetical protein [Pseudaquidulcibacter saccharophilus]|uniref:hypothetical protein n=1 Tax=Pseudaquidulcibacter saccharophilus TaxID=2831900 RepID=UPI001EFF48F4|nr:hypothetical protein [Pseudaquidulcibacter saccharophilus]
MLDSLLEKYGVKKFAKFAKYFSIFASLYFMLCAVTERAYKLGLIDIHLKLIPNENGIISSLLNPNYWVELISQVFFAIAIFNCATLFEKISTGEKFTNSMVIQLEAIGSNLFFGFIAAAFIQPFLIDLFRGVFHCCRIGFDNQNLLAGVMGALLFTIGKIGQKLRVELDEIV